MQHEWMNIGVMVGVCVAVMMPSEGRAQPPGDLPQPALVLPLGRTAYFVGEKVPLAVSGVDASKEVRLEAINGDGRMTLYNGKPSTLLLDTSLLAPGDYSVEVNGVAVLARLTITSPLKKSAGSMQDEWVPAEPQLDNTKKYTATERAEAIGKQGDSVHAIFRESGLSACVALGAEDMGQAHSLDTLARSGAIMLVNPDTRPTSFLPVGNSQEEIDGMSQRMILTAQANGRYPNFAGFCFGWDTTGYAVGGRRMLLTYWAWGDKTDALRTYIDRLDKQKTDEFTKRTGLKPVTEEEYISYLLSIKRPEFATAIDLTTKVWLDELAPVMKPLAPAELAAFDKRLAAWSGYLMGLYNECYGAYVKNLAAVDPTLRHSSSVQSDHCPVRQGQYFPSAYEPLDFRYQSTWNDQIGGPDYLYQGLLVQALLAMGRGDKPIWISNAIGAAHGRASYPGKFVRVAAHGLAYGASGIGFALEGFSNILGGMNPATNWKNMKGQSGEADVLSGRDFMDRFAGLTVEGRGDHGVGILWSKTQYSRQHVTMGFGVSVYQVLVGLTRLGYTPRFVTDEELAAGTVNDVKAIVVLGQTFPFPAKVQTGLEAFVKQGGRVLVDGNTTVSIAGAVKLDHAYSFSMPGKPHNWGSPNMVRGENETVLYERWHPQNAKALAAALGDTGRGVLKSDAGDRAKISLMQLDGGREARYVVAVNDSWVETQADWFQVKERLLPCNGFAGGMLYDCTEERLVGTLAPVECDLSATIARVYAVLPRGLESTALAVTQKIHAGEPLGVSVAFLDADKKPLEAVLPFHVTVLRPDGKIYQEFYRATPRPGRFTMELPLARNVPVGRWTVSIRCQLTGESTSLPVEVVAAEVASPAVAWGPSVVVRNGESVAKALAKGSTVVIPIFSSTNAYSAWVKASAEKAKAVLSARGVKVEILENPVIGTYHLGYALSDTQKLDNAKVDAGTAIGKLSRETVNRNDWFSGLSGWRCSKTVLLLDVATPGGGQPMAVALDKNGMLWPSVTADFPGAGKAVVQGVDWAFGPRETAIVVQAADAEGLMAGVMSLAKLPADELTPGIRLVKDQMWKEYHVGGNPPQPELKKLTDKGLVSRQDPNPFTMMFPNGVRPPEEGKVVHPEMSELVAKPVPIVFSPQDFVLHYFIDGKPVETETVRFLVPDLRFSEAIMVVAEVKEAAKFKIAAAGVFRYSDRKPCWQAQWEDIISMREKLIPKERKPIEFEVMVNGKRLGKLVAVKQENKDVQVSMNPPTKVNEEVVTRCEGEIELPTGRAEIMLIKRNIVDGTLEAVGVGAEPVLPLPPPAAKK